MGSIVSVTDSTGNVVESYKYSSFGKPTIFDNENKEIASSAIGNSYTYTGREYDSETGLFYYRNRYYDSDLGVFVSKDPIGFSGGINLYQYVGANPVNWVNPWGYSWKSWVALGGTVIAAAAGMAGAPVIATIAGGIAAGAAAWEVYDWMTGDAEELINDTIMETTEDDNINPADVYKDSDDDGIPDILDETPNGDKKKDDKCKPR